MKKDLTVILSYTHPEGECLIWNRCLNTDGYPRAVIDGNFNAKVHRVVHELSIGQPIDNVIVRHTCDNPKCINPSHLISGTLLDNVRDMDERGRRGNCKLNKQAVIAARELYATGKHRIKDLAELFKVTSTNMSSLLSRKHWKHVQ